MVDRILGRLALESLPRITLYVLGSTLYLPMRVMQPKLGKTRNFARIRNSLASVCRNTSKPNFGASIPKSTRKTATLQVLISILNQEARRRFEDRPQWLTYPNSHFLERSSGNLAEQRYSAVHLHRISGWTWIDTGNRSRDAVPR